MLAEPRQTRLGFSGGNDFNQTVRRLFGNTSKRLVYGLVAGYNLTGRPASVVRDILNQTVWMGWSYATRICRLIRSARDRVNRYNVLARAELAVHFQRPIRLPHVAQALIRHA